MPSTIYAILETFANQVKEIFGENLKKIIVYGSYARGDYTSDSDIDLIILVTLEEEGIRRMFNDVCDLAFDYEMEYGIVISTLIKNEHHFDEWAEDLPFYKNICREGVPLNV